MYRLLIVDDEPFIVEGLVQLFQDMEPRLDVCKAYTAIEALTIIQKMKIDLIISDIRMPEKNGLQLIDELKYYWPSCKVVFLTGYDEFDYVYSAIQKNADFYVLKTEDDAVLMDAVTQCIHKIEEETKNRNMTEAASRQMALMGPLLKKEIYEALLFGENLSGMVEEEQLEGHTPNLDKQFPVLLLTCRVESREAEMTWGEKLNAYYSIQSLVEEHMTETIHCESFVFEHSTIVWFIQPYPDEQRFYQDGAIDWKSLTTYLKGVLESVQNAFYDWGGPGLCFVIARKEAYLSEIHKEFELMRAMMRKRYSLIHSMTVIDLGLPNGIWNGDTERMASSTFPFRKQTLILEAALEEGNVAHFESVCRELIGAIRREMNVHYLTGVEQYYSFILVFLQVMNSSDIAGLTRDGIHVEHISIMEIPDDWDTVSSYIVELGKYICACKHQLQQEEGDALIRNVHAFVHEQLNKDLTLVRIAEAMFFNPSYLSRYYKQQTGRNLSEYIHSAKLAAAQQLLTNPDLKVNEIAEKLGFSSPSYFTNFFRKMTDRTPQEYREGLARKQGK